VDIFKVAPEKAAKIRQLPTSLKEALEALRQDHEFLLRGNVFTEDLMEAWLEQKMAEADDVRQRPHPYEISLYYDL
jgi:glutamine synthetase